MDERAIKRLLLIFVASIIAIVLIKLALTRTYASLNHAAAVKKQAASAPQQTPSLASGIIDTPAASSDTATTVEK